MSSKHDTSNNKIGISNFVDVKGLSRDRPWLLPSNRKLRHLQGISLRNLTFDRPATRPRGKSIDDESLPNAFKSPTKLLAQRESHKLEHSRSSIDLKSSPKQNGSQSSEILSTGGLTQFRPTVGKLRRRSTLNWTNARPQVRQKKLEDIIRDRLADTWFSLHCSDIPEPVYVSEIVDKAMNPSFRFFDLNTYGPSVTRRDELTIKYWAKTENMDDYILLVELQLHLRSLQFVGKSLESFHHPLPPNCVLFHLSDGIYTSFTDLPLEEPVLDALRPIKPPPQGLQLTSSFDALMRLSNLDDCIQDALLTREKLTSQINSLLQEQQTALETINAASQAEESLASTNRAVNASRKSLKAAVARRSELQASLQARRAAIASGTESQEKALAHLTAAQANLSSRASLLDTTETAISGQIRRICEDILRICPIEPTPRKLLSFTIGNLALPNATSHSASAGSDAAVTAAALSLVAHTVNLLSFYLTTPLPYPISIHGSTSTILDPISTSLHSSPARIFPLYQKGVVPYRFDYAVFLLNTDIELLMSRQGLRMVDLRHTLPNLKYLLTVLTTGNGELPVRKRGGIRGLGAGAGGELEGSRDSGQDLEYGMDQGETAPYEENGWANGKQPVSKAEAVIEEVE